MVTTEAFMRARVTGIVAWHQLSNSSTVRLALVYVWVSAVAESGFGLAYLTAWLLA